MIVVMCILGASVSGCSKKSVDLDLSKMSSVMAYAQLTKIYEKPGDYMGKTIKVKGPYRSFFYDVTGLYYHSVAVGDATQCCLKYLEFEWKGEHIFPDDYPEENTEIVIEGVLGSYDELGETYYYLTVDWITIVKKGKR